MPSFHAPSLRPTPRKLKRMVAYPSCDIVFASVTATLLSIVPPICGCGCATSATPRASMPGCAGECATSSAPAGPAINSTIGWPGRMCDLDPQALDRLAAAEVAVDD